MLPAVHTPEEAAKLIRCKPSWLKDKARAREIPFTLVGGAYRFTDAHLEWILAHFEHLPEADTLPAPRRVKKRQAEPVPDGVRLVSRPSKRLTAAS